jgi:hypothetical protein
MQMHVWNHLATAELRGGDAHMYMHDKLNTGSTALFWQNYCATAVLSTTGDR